jgi:hypothetical protein
VRLTLSIASCFKRLHSTNGFHTNFQVLCSFLTLHFGSYLLSVVSGPGEHDKQGHGQIHLGLDIFKT